MLHARKTKTNSESTIFVLLINPLIGLFLLLLLCNQPPALFITIYRKKNKYVIIFVDYPVVLFRYFSCSRRGRVGSKVNGKESRPNNTNATQIDKTLGLFNRSIDFVLVCWVILISF